MGKVQPIATQLDVSEYLLICSRPGESGPSGWVEYEYLQGCVRGLKRALRQAREMHWAGWKVTVQGTNGSDYRYELNS